MKDYKSEIEHWKTLDRYHMDWTFRDVVNSFDQSLDRVCELESMLLRLTEQLDNEHVSEEFCEPLINEAKKLIAF